jgi:hypothetical protein
MSYPLFTPLSNTLVEHKIKIEVAPELKLPPPRPVRRRRRRFPVGVSHVLILPFVFLGVLLLLTLLSSILKIIFDDQSPFPMLKLLLITLFWNACTAIFVWRIYLRPLVYRWLVIHGQATIGHITGFNMGGGGGSVTRIHYEFSTASGQLIKTKAEVDSSQAWEELTGSSANTVIDVLYSEKQPLLNAPYLCANYEVANDVNMI